MKKTIAVLLMAVAAGCGAPVIPDDHITQLSQRLQPVANNWRRVCQVARGCMEAAGRDTTDLVNACETGWQGFQTIEAYQAIYCQLRGIECSRISYE
jgi:hypothetical protein